ncbi:unnamed protein product, partial [Bubo scandiacus]
MQVVVLSIAFARCIKPPVVNVYLAFTSCGNYPRKSCCFKTGFQLLQSSCPQKASYEVHQLVE